MPYIAPPFTPSVTISGTDLIRNTDEKLQTIANDVGDYLETQTQEALTELEDTMGGIEAQFDVINSESNGYVTQALNAKNQAEASATTATTQAGIATTKANEASISAATATAKANLATSVVIPTTATYNYTTQDWRGSMMSKAQFNALASERRANRAGSGDEGYYNALPTTQMLPINNDGLIVTKYATSVISGTNSDRFALMESKFSVNGCMHRVFNHPTVYSNPNYGLTSYFASGKNGTVVQLPPAPTIYPYDATLTTEQIASGVIKHADSSNSGLIVNGKFDVNTSGWTATNGTISVSSNKLLLTNGTSLECQAYQSFTTVIGKKYTLEIYNEDGTSLTNGIKVGIAINGSTLVNLSNVASATRSQVDFTATSATTFITLTTGITTTGQTALFDNIAVFPADAISRSDIVFPESWHEDVSEKDFVYPLGNVQYLGTTGDSGTPVAGAFAGSATYSLFSDTWQADNELVGKGYVWSALSDVNNKAFVANPENNCYLDGDKVIQVRYRIRVVAGMGDSWSDIDPQSGHLRAATGWYVRPKGKQVVQVQGDIGNGADTNGIYGNKLTTWTNLLAWNDNGVWVGADAYGDTNGYLAGSYNGQCFALPIALIHRRNKGGYNATYNPNGTKAMTMTPSNISDCFNNANLTTATGYIGTSTPRGDGLFYDQVSVEDFKPSNKGADLRNSSKKRTAQSIIEEFAPKALASTIPFYNNDTTPLTTYKDFMEVRDTSGNCYGMVSKVGNVVTIGSSVANKKGFSVVTQNGKQYLQVADDVASDTTVQMNLSTIKYDIGVFDA